MFNARGWSYVNKKNSARVSVKYVIMQGTFWGSLKCTSSKDTMNKIAFSEEDLQYKYKGDPNIPVGILGVVDDTFSISEYGNKSIIKNSFVNA